MKVVEERKFVQWSDLSDSIKGKLFQIIGLNEIIQIIGLNEIKNNIGIKVQQNSWNNWFPNGDVLKNSDNIGFVMGGTLATELSFSQGSIIQSLYTKKTRFGYWKRKTRERNTK